MMRMILIILLCTACDRTASCPPDMRPDLNDGICQWACDAGCCDPPRG